MKLLKERILRDGISLDGGVLKVDSFINHQMDSSLMKSIAVEFVKQFAHLPITKIITIEASGIAPAIMVGYLLEIPVLFVKKATPKTMADFYMTKTYSFTKDRTYDIVVSKQLLQAEDRLLFIDDFLANGNAAQAVDNLVQQAGASLLGMGFIIEKAFQEGGQKLRALPDMKVVSLARIKELGNNKIVFEEEA